MSENDAKAWKEKLFYKPLHAAKTMTREEIEAADSFCEGYMSFLDAAKTEREAVEQALILAKANGFHKYEPGKYYPPGSRVYAENRGKALILAVTGTLGVSQGARVTASHIDSPRLDLKPSPLTEDGGMALFKTHYYGGIKKYQWTAIPLALHGVLVKTDGTVVRVSVGEEENEPKFVISDLLIHLAQDQMKATLAEGVKGEALNVLVGSRPFDGSDEAQNVKLNILHILFEKYGITEADFLSAELEVVPAFRACDIGFDRSMIGAYGHDDRVCAYTALMSILDTEEPESTAVCVLADKEEIGSQGNTGMDSAFLAFFIADLARSEGLQPGDVFSMSKALSTDVNSVYDPNYPDVFDKTNVSLLNCGVVLKKYTGARGKSSASDASAELVGEIRALLTQANVPWQMGEMGKVDVGGGGTVAKFLAMLNIDVVDLGVPVLSMHAPFEVVSKLDTYAAYRACVAFYSREGSFFAAKPEEA